MIGKDDQRGPEKDLSHRKKVYGVGINDADYKVCKRELGKRIYCPYYLTWVRVLQRCSETYQRKHPSYKGVQICEEWKRFSNFKHWMERQQWKDARGNSYQLDKDYLGSGKLYSPKTCWFCEHWLNSLLLDHARGRGKYMIGVYKEKNESTYRAHISIDGKVKNLGGFSTEIEAHKAWATAKRAYVIEKMKGYRNKKVADAVIAKMKLMTAAIDA